MTRVSLEVAGAEHPDGSTALRLQSLPFHLISLVFVKIVQKSHQGDSTRRLIRPSGLHFDWCFM